MKRFLMAIAAAALVPVTAVADGFCGVSDPAVVYERLAGSWVREGSTSVEGSVTSFVRPARMFATEIDKDGQYYSGFVDSLMGEKVALTWAAPKPYDVDRVDDVLDTTGREDLADLLSDTHCGPEALPQLQIVLPEFESGISVFGTITLVPYFDNRVLEISEVTLKSDETVLFMTETVLLRPAE
ncbi:hypothetical protein [Shimia sagamensis]|uniref:THAP4-like heme-binding beta-barrel domain-containing protein n=1 Tax=Shimia sagamensis TaxID=1566352 RepID=A0ABY1NZ83_9RHOB|nr:hypothetical protein [Shimia sagamensis]SMP22497.1 hypothetical protein SAMN06265373_104211 [Shimia sagamensis]